MQNALYTVN